MPGQKDLLFDFSSTEPQTDTPLANKSSKPKSADTVRQNHDTPVKEYSFADIIKSSTEYFDGDELAASVWAIFRGFKWIEEKSV